MRASIILLTLVLVSEAEAQEVSRAQASAPLKAEIKLPNPASSLDRIARSQEASIALKEAERSDDRPARDLAAQEEMAKWAKLSFFAVLAGTVLSAAGLLALLCSLRLNRRATNAAQSAVVVAKEASVAQSRAWISIACSLGKPEEGRTQDGRDGIYFNVTCLVRNHGHAPATGVSCHADISLLNAGTPDAHALMTAFSDATRSMAAPEAEAVFPESSATFSHMVFLPKTAIESDLAAREFKMIVPVVFGCINYRSPSTEGVRQTRFAFHVASTDESGNVVVLRPEIPGWLERPIHLIGPGTIACD